MNRESCSQESYNIHRKTPVLESFFKNENADLQSSNFIKKRLQHRCFSVNIAKFLRALVLKNIRERLFERFPI